MTSLVDHIMSLPEEDLSCPICYDIFTDPVLLSCSHSFCRSCVKRCWDASNLRECPVCRKKASRSSPPSNLALKNLCETHVKNRRLSEGKEVIVCDLHGEQLKLFCLVDKQPICVVCQSSKLHKNHDCAPIEETLDYKGELNTTLENLQDQLKKLIIIQENSGAILSHIKNQEQQAQSFIKNQFEQLHQALHDEESVKLAALKMEADEKITAIQDKMSETAAEMLSLSETIQTLEEKLRADDMVYMQNFKATLERGNSMKHGSENMPGAMIDVSKHLCNLKYRIWEKLHDHVEYTPLTLDPNTAHPCLILSDDLTSLHYSSQPLCFPNNPERFHVSAEVVGTTALGSGSVHRWIVETGNNHDWLLGVASASVPRDMEVSARPENGFWTLCLRDGELRAMTSPPTPLAVARKPCRVKVKLDYDKGMVSFLDSADDALLYSFTHKFTETLLPYFYTQSSYPLKILPENVFVARLHR